MSASRSKLLIAGVSVVAALAGGTLGGAALSGCGQMDAALGKQWVDVTFKPDASAAVIEQVAAACSHVPNVHPYPLAKHPTMLDRLAGVRFDTTNATDANVAQLQECVQKFGSVQGFTPGDTGDEGG